MEIKKILVIRFRRVGDSLLSLVLCSSLRKSFPYAQIDYVMDKNISSFYDNHPDIDNLILFDNEEKHSLRKYVGKVRKLMSENKYDVIIDTRSTVQTLWFSLFSLHTPYRIGRKKGYNALLHNYRIGIPEDDNLNIVTRNHMLLKPLEREAKIEYVSDFKLYVTDEEKKGFRLYMEKQGIDFSRPVVIAAVTARSPHKIWNKERMKEILRKMIDKYDTQIIFNFAGDIEKNYALEMHKEMGMDSGIFTNIEAKGLRELCALISNCSFFFGNEGGPRHVAQALSVPAFAVFPPCVSKTVWLPAGSDDRYQGIAIEDFVPAEQIKSEMTLADKFEFLTVDKVWEILDVMLAKYLS